MNPDFPLPPLAPEPSPQRKRELYSAAGVGCKPPLVEGSTRPVVPNVLIEDVEGINRVIAAEAATCLEKTRPKAEEERRLREAAVRDAALRATQERVDEASTIGLQRRVPSPIARFLAEHEELDGKLTAFEVRRLMQQQAINTVARRNLLTTEKKKVLRSHNYPIVKKEPVSKLSTAEGAPPQGESIRRWYQKLGAALP
jgi:hypothetical protein